MILRRVCDQIACFLPVYDVCTVTSTYVSTGGSVSNALFMAVSTRVGNCLGEGDPSRAKKASIVGFFFAAGAGAIISTAIFGPSMFPSHGEGNLALQPNPSLCC